MGRSINFVPIRKNEVYNLSHYEGEQHTVLEAFVEWLRYNRENLNDDDANSLLSIVDESDGISFIKEEASKISKNADLEIKDSDEDPDLDEFINPFEDPDEYTDEISRYTFYEILEKYKDFLIKNQLYGLRIIILKFTRITSNDSKEFLKSWNIVKNHSKKKLGTTLSCFLGESASERKTFVIEDEYGSCYEYGDY
jgi:hypothetical protein